jgi:hypothetical protein
VHLEGEPPPLRGSPTWHKETVTVAGFSNTLALFKRFPCAPTGKQLRRNKSIKKILVKLLNEQSGHRAETQLENGGWIYQKTNGIFFFEKAPNSVRKSGSINLSSPPNIRNARVIAKVHTHPFPAGLQDSINSTEGNGNIYNTPRGYETSPLYENRATGPSAKDGTASIPSLVVFEAADFGEPGTASVWIASVGPSRVNNVGCR